MEKNNEAFTKVRSHKKAHLTNKLWRKEDEVLELLEYFFLISASNLMHFILTSRSVCSKCGLKL